MNTSHKISTGVIHKIVVGDDQLNGLVFKVGQEAIKGSGNIVHLIVEDENNYHLFGNICYRVFYKTPNGQEKQWKKFVNVPVGVEYDSESDKTYA
jgi:hypothetical protein